MNRILAIVAGLITFSVSGQQIERRVIHYPKSKDVQEVFDVLKSNNKIKHGDYYAFYKGQLTMKQLKSIDTLSKNSLLGFKEFGQFRNNLKEGHWEFFKPFEKTVTGVSRKTKSEEGQYLNDRKVGIWSMYFENGKVIKRFDFDSNKELETSVKFSFNYPEDARKNSVEGTVMVKVTYSNCEPITYQTVKDIGYGCADAIIDALKEKSSLEKKYGIKSTSCGKSDEVLSFKFKLN